MCRSSMPLRVKSFSTKKNKKIKPKFNEHLTLIPLSNLSNRRSNKVKCTKKMSESKTHSSRFLLWSFKLLFILFSNTKSMFISLSTSSSDSARNKQHRKLLRASVENWCLEKVEWKKKDVKKSHEMSVMFWFFQIAVGDLFRKRKKCKRFSVGVE